MSPLCSSGARVCFLHGDSFVVFFGVFMFSLDDPRAVRPSLCLRFSFLSLLSFRVLPGALCFSLGGEQDPGFKGKRVCGRTI